jgi:two-component system, sensor histidine kinase YesM
MKSKLQGIRRRFFYTRFLRYLILMLIPILLFSSVFQWMFRKHVTGIIETDKAQITNLSLLTMDHLFGELEKVRIFIETNPDYHLSLLQELREENPGKNVQQDLDRIKEYLTASLNANPYIHSYYIGKQTSPFIIVDGERRDRNTWFDTGWLDDYPAGQTGWVRCRNIREFAFETQGVPVISVYRLTRYNEIITINIYRNYLVNLLNEITSENGEMVYLLDKDGTVIARSSSAMAYAPHMDGKYYTVSKPLERYGLYCLDLIPRSTMLAPVYMMLRVSAFTALLAFLLSALLALAFSRKEYLKIARILDTIETNTGQSFDIDVVGKNGDVHYYILQTVIQEFIAKSRLEKELSDHQYALLCSRMATLQYQINPHFMFNTLQSIDDAVLQETGHAGAGNRMIGLFAELLRYSLEDPSDMVTVKREVTMTVTFEELAKYRTGNRMLVVWDYDEEKIAELRVPRLLFQPLLENVMNHGLQEDGQRTIVKIRMVLTGSLLEICLIDNGPGMDPSRLEGIRATLDKGFSTDGRRVGLRNVHNRLVLLYGQECGLRLYSRPGHGFCIFFRLKSKKNS